MGQVLQGCLSHGTSFGLQPKAGKKLCGILVFRSSWPLVGGVVWSGLNVNTQEQQIRSGLGCWRLGLAGSIGAGGGVVAVITLAWWERS